VAQVYHVRDTIPVAQVPSGEPVAQLWNPHATRAINVIEAGYGVFGDVSAAAGTIGRWVLQRSTARGASAASVTPAAAESDDNRATCPSGSQLDTAAWSVVPTLASPPLVAPLTHTYLNLDATQPYFSLPLPRGIVVPHGTGLCLVMFNSGGDTFTLHDVWFTFED
jgi:hypothetical protein